jgi:secretion/DNA translocation related TadE-like protein
VTAGSNTVTAGSNTMAAGSDDVTPGSDVTPGTEDVWAIRRRWGETLRRWAGPVQSSTPHPRPPAPTSNLPARPRRLSTRRLAKGIGRRYASRLHLRPTTHLGRRDHGDRGAATIFVLAVGLALVLMGVAGAAVGAARVGRHQAQAAADLGALAGAARAVDGADAACERAGRFVSANGGLVTSCQVSGLEIIVRTEVTVTPLPGLTRHATAAARAGPVYAAGS